MKNNRQSATLIHIDEEVSSSDLLKTRVICKTRGVVVYDPEQQISCLLVGRVISDDDLKKRGVAYDSYAWIYPIEVESLKRFSKKIRDMFAGDPQDVEFAASCALMEQES